VDAKVAHEIDSAEQSDSKQVVSETSPDATANSNGVQGKRAHGAR
jgi:hypothetical protein